MLEFPGLLYSCWEFAVMVLVAITHIRLQLPTNCGAVHKTSNKQINKQTKKAISTGMTIKWGTAYIRMALHELCQLTPFIIHPNNLHSSLCSVMQLYLQT